MIYPFSALVVDVHVLGVDHLVRGAGSARTTRRPGTGTRLRPRLSTALLAPVHDLGQLVRGLGERLGRLLHGRGLVALQRPPGFADRPLELALLVRTELLLVLLVGLLRAVDQ